MKEFIKEKLMFPLNIQLFAEEEDPADVEEEEEEEEEGKEGTKKKAKTFTQDEVSKMAAKEKRQGRLAAFKALGIDPRNKEQVAQAKELLKGLSGAGKESTEKNDEANKEAEKKVREAEQKAFEADCKVKALEFGANPKFVNDVIILAMSRMNEGDELDDVMGEVKEMYPTMFSKVSNEEETNEEEEEESKEDDKSRKKKGTGKSIGEFKKRVAKAGKADSLGASLAKLSKGKQVKKSMFD